ncbi:hypothetical protein [Sulfobacillus harzensis]|uniref:Uncharacterized protein n=1 Tax=Sulfobacillus harzensis TaxID=2729629 RepID=A0A7Y0L1G0_9FIRM|nr:hypothetical protein [Sulfobacillus harzensis]NMP21460.1 hypothetical protein [Sulfobacillus harzensis]
MRVGLSVILAMGISVLSLAAPGPSEKPSGGGSKTVTLVLRNAHGNAGVKPHPIFGVTTIQAPLYPHSRISRQSWPPGMGQSLSVSPYARQGSTRVWSAPKSPKMVMRWYRTYFSDHGDMAISYSRAENGRGAEVEDITYAKNADSALTWDIAFYPASPHQTLYVITAIDQVIPPRPRNTLIPKDIRRVAGMIHEGGRMIPIRTAKRSKIAALVRVLNQPRSPYAPFSAPFIRDRASLKLYPSHGRVITVLVDKGWIVSIQGIALSNPHSGRLWQAVAALSSGG